MNSHKVIHMDIAGLDSWWKEMTRHEQKKYAKEHPGGRHRTFNSDKTKSAKTDVKAPDKKAAKDLPRSQRRTPEKIEEDPNPEQPLPQSKNLKVQYNHVFKKPDPTQVSHLKGKMERHLREKIDDGELDHSTALLNYARRNSANKEDFVKTLQYDEQYEPFRKKLLKGILIAAAIAGTVALGVYVAGITMGSAVAIMGPSQLAASIGPETLVDFAHHYYDAPQFFDPVKSILESGISTAYNYMSRSGEVAETLRGVLGIKLSIVDSITMNTANLLKDFTDMTGSSPGGTAKDLLTNAMQRGK